MEMELNRKEYKNKCKSFLFTMDDWESHHKELFIGDRPKNIKETNNKDTHATNEISLLELTETQRN